MYWSPRVQICFTDEELVQNLLLTHDRPERRTGNWWTFFSHLCRNERERLEHEAVRRWAMSFLQQQQCEPQRDGADGSEDNREDDLRVPAHAEVAAEPAGPEIMWQP